jgi:hypothetical protein
MRRAGFKQPNWLWIKALVPCSSHQIFRQMDAHPRKNCIKGFQPSEACQTNGPMYHRHTLETPKIKAVGKGSMMG